MPGQQRRYALQNAVRLALAGTCAFALGMGPIDNSQTAIFGIFGCFGLLLFADFGGSPRERLRDYAALALAGVPLIVFGTLCSQHLGTAIAGMFVVGFAILFSGVLGGTFAAASTSAILAFVLSVTIQLPMSEVGDRLLGWGIAAAFAIPAVMLLWPARPRDRLRAAAGAGCRAFAQLVAVRAGEGDTAKLEETARRAVLDLRRTFYATPFRPSGATGRAAALAALADDLDYLSQFSARAQPAGGYDFPRERVELEQAVAQVLDAVAARLEQRHATEPADFERLARARRALGDAMLASIATAQPGDEPRIERELEQAFGLRMLSYATWHLAADGLQACGEVVPEVDEVEAAEASTTGPRAAALAAGGTVAASSRLAAAYASTRSVLFQNSLRGAIGLALAVAIGVGLDLQHGFWVVLGVVSVLRSRALSTGATVVQAIAGTFAGIVVGGMLVALIDGNRTLLWIALPLTVLLVGYAPRAISFIAGQASFSLCVLVLFNLIEPVGWKVGLVRIEDVAIGGAISLGVGLLLWPRGAAALLRRSLAAAYASSAAALSATVAQRMGSADPAALQDAVSESIADARRLDDAFRQYLAEPAGQHQPFADLSRLVSSCGRVRRTAHSLRVGSVLLPLTEVRSGATPALTQRRALLEAELEQVDAWLRALGNALATGGPPPAPQPGADASEADAAGVRVLQTGDGAPLTATVTIAWTRQHLVALRHLEPRLAEAAETVRPRQPAR
ncbi:FUSC family protein [Conexibacter sp. CPCC 206217]|uniref:FUSC family protein n=1 Tax=Conexibacter sp. CPCC 206217 TaxID=3064574 RepID=UPI002717E7AD|nr:FUSC family protein [Conexibacter sp. CPCC 206217]MDO8213018.1 FUSC family protein [Conexibacter sp. CPCC 206217]